MAETVTTEKPDVSIGKFLSPATNEQGHAPRARTIPKEHNIREFSSKEISKGIVDFLIRKNIIESPSSVKQEDIADELCEFLEKEFPEISHVETIRKQFSTSVKTPNVKLEQSEDNLVVYLRNNFKNEIERGFLPLTEVDDPYLRARVSTAKKQGKFPEDLQNVCLVKSEILYELRRAFAGLVGQDDFLASNYLKFVKKIFPKSGKSSGLRPFVAK